MPDENVYPMATLLKHYVTFIVLIFVTHAGMSQSGEFIAGTIKDKETGSTIGFASIGITHTTLGTAADASGAFRLIIDSRHRGEQIKVTCIGYVTKVLPIDSLLALQGEVTINLVPDVALLDEVVVAGAPIDPANIIREAVNAVKINYPQEPFNLKLYSVIHANDSLQGKTFKVETILLGYYDGYHAEGTKKFEIQHKRTTGEDPLTRVGYGYWPSFEVVSADLLTDPAKRGVFNLDLLELFDFQYEGVSLYDEDTVYNITYVAPKPTTRITGYGIVPKTYKGRLSITTGTHAVVSHEILASAFSYRVIYKKVGDHYYPYYFSGERTNEFKLPGGKRPFTTVNAITVTEIIREDVRVIPPKANEYDMNTVPFDEQFWNGAYPVEE